MADFSTALRSARNNKGVRKCFLSKARTVASVEMTRFELATPFSEQIPGFYAVVFHRIIGIKNWLIYLIFFLDQPQKTL